MPDPRPDPTPDSVPDPTPGPAPSGRRGPQPWLIGILTAVYLFVLLRLAGITAIWPSLGLTVLAVGLAFATHRLARRLLSR